MGSKRDVFDTHTFSANGDKVYDVSDYEAVFYVLNVTSVDGTTSVTVNRAVDSSGTYVTATTHTLSTTTPDGAVIDVRGVNSLKFTTANISGSETISLEASGWSG
tara:strand:- start:530 stop:844 length:315 start_codon:yes stop_codon:yes gene_type:complete